MHINELQNAIKHRPNADFTVLLVNIQGVQPENVDLKKIKTGGQFKMEVIGGLHTYRAIKSLIENEEEYEDDEEFTTRTVRLYAGLNSIQCMKIGYDHNVASQTHRATTFEEYCKMFRKELRASLMVSPSTDVPEKLNASQQKAWRDRLCTILSIKVSYL